MKKILAIIMAICMLATVLCVPAFAALLTELDAAPVGTVLRLSALKKNGIPVVIKDYDNFEDGWEAVVDYAEDTKTMKANGYDRVVVDFYADWIANEDGEFGNGGDGFEWSTIHITEDIRITLNLNNHTINRNLKEWEYDGEVIYIDDNADVIINNGTITGGWSCNGAGGIHICDKAKVVLNNVNIVGNRVDDDDGAGIAVYDGAVLTMNGGCVSHIESYNAVYGGGVYIDDGSAVFTDVTFENNQGFERSTHGAAVYVDDGTLIMEGCKVIGNGLTLTNDGTTCFAAYSIIDISNGSKVTITETEFLENGYAQETYVSRNVLKYTSVISSKASYLTIEKCTFSDNNQVYLIESEATVFNAFDSDLSQNKSFAFYGNCAGGFNSAFTNCKFSYNEPLLGLDDTFFFNVANAGLSFVDCDFGEATFNNKSAAQFADTAAPNGSVASLFGEGSLALIVASVALIASIASIIVNVTARKKKTVPVTKTESSEEGN
jgi:hypothetical protein